MAANVSRPAPTWRRIEEGRVPPPLPVRSLTYSVYTVFEHDVSVATSRGATAFPAPVVPFAEARRSRAAFATWLGRLPWRAVGIGLAVTGGAFLVFLFAVVTVAELTDDLKPARKSSLAHVPPAAPSVSLPPGVAAVAVAAAPASPIEIDEAPPAKKPVAKAQAKARTKPRKPPAERFLP